MHRHPRSAGPDGGLDDETEGLVAFPILDLLPELVIHIIEQAVVISSKDEPIVIKDDAKAHQEPAITRVCRLFRSEGLPFFYKHNDFAVLTSQESTFEFFQWVCRMGLQRASTIQSLRAYWHIDESLAPLDWQHFLCEMEFLIATAHDMRLKQTFRDQFFVRFQDGKVVLGTGSLGRYYKLSFSHSIQAGAEWRQVAELSSSYLSKSSERRLRDKDFWVSDSSSDITASNVDQQEGARAVEYCVVHE